jgi:exonuclease III
MMNKIKVATLNVKGLNNKSKAQKTLTLLKTYKLDIIFLQETNLEDVSTRNFLAQQWKYDSIWSSKTAILAGNKGIKFTNSQKLKEGRIIITRTTYKHYNYLLTNVYAPPRQDERKNFFSNWTPTKDEEVINIVAGDFNTNINSEKNRISQAPPQRDPSHDIVRDIFSDFIDTADFAKPGPFLTFYQTTHGNQKMATRLDYIFIDSNHGQFCKNTCTRFGNSDHLLVESELVFKSEPAYSSSWKFNRKYWSIPNLKQEITEIIKSTQDYNN